MPKTKPHNFNPAFKRSKNRIFPGKEPTVRLCPKCYGVLDTNLVCRTHGQAEVCRRCKSIKPCGCDLPKLQMPQTAIEATETPQRGIKQVKLRNCLLCDALTPNKSYCDPCGNSKKYQLLRYYSRKYHLKAAEAAQIVRDDKLRELFKASVRKPRSIPARNACLICGGPTSHKWCMNHRGKKGADLVQYYRLRGGKTEAEAVVIVRQILSERTRGIRQTCSSCGREVRNIRLADGLCIKCQRRSDPDKIKGQCISCGGDLYGAGQFCREHICHRKSQSYTYYSRSGYDHDTILIKLGIHPSQRENVA